MLWDRVRPGENLNMLSARLGRPACMIMRANRLASPAWLLPGREIIVPPADYCIWDAGECPNTFFNCPARSVSPRIRHAVRPGERISSIAAKYALPERLIILAAGKHTGDALPAGLVLELPVLPRDVRIVTVLPGQTVESICLRCHMPRERFALLNSLSAQVMPGMRVVIEEK